MLRCRICGFKTASKITMHSHISSAHRTTVIRDYHNDDAVDAMAASNLANFFDGSCDTESRSIEDDPCTLR